VICYLDTQVMVWLCQRRLDRLTSAATTAIQESELLLSPMVLLELAYLYEIKRIIRPPLALLNQLETQLGLKLCQHSFPAVIQAALFETWTRDPFDRVIVAQARANAYAALVTSDDKIQENYPNTVW